jgi:hypothetical protein
MSLGEIKHIEINVKVAYILYEFYFSAVLAYNIISETIKKRGLKQLLVKLIPKEDEKSEGSNANTIEASVRNLPFSSVLLELNDKADNKEGRAKLKEDVSLPAENFIQSHSLPFINNYGIQYSDIVSVSPVGNTYRQLAYEAEEIINPSLLFNYKYITSSNSYYDASKFMADVEYYTSYCPMNQGAFQKYICNYDVQIENDPVFRVTKRLIGIKGATVKKILYDSCSIYKDNSTKLRLRGKGSGYREGVNNEGKIILMLESEDPLQLCISSWNYYAFLETCRNVEKLLSKVYYEYYLYLLYKCNVDNYPKTIKKYDYIVYR